MHRDGKVKDMLSVLKTSHPKGLLLRERSGQNIRGERVHLVAYDELMQVFLKHDPIIG